MGRLFLKADALSLTGHCTPGSFQSVVSCSHVDTRVCSQLLMLLANVHNIGDVTRSINIRAIPGVSTVIFGIGLLGDAVDPFEHVREGDSVARGGIDDIDA